jgi:hypothetical protein
MLSPPAASPSSLPVSLAAHWRHPSPWPTAIEIRKLPSHTFVDAAWLATAEFLARPLGGADRDKRDNDQNHHWTPEAKQVVHSKILLARVAGHGSVYLQPFKRTLATERQPCNARSVMIRRRKVDPFASMLSSETRPLNQGCWQFTAFPSPT